MGRCILHHVTWWRDGGTTDIANAAPLCHRHHDLVHDEGWTFEMDPASRIVTWTASDGTVHVDHPRGPACDPGRDSTRSDGGDEFRARPGRAPGSSRAERGPPGVTTDPASKPLRLDL